MPREPWRPVDVVVGVIAATLCLFLLLVSFRVIFFGADMNEEESQRLAVFLMALLAIVSTWVGLTNRDKGDGK